jgi:hypothetical protein
MAGTFGPARACDGSKSMRAGRGAAPVSIAVAMPME